MHRREIEEILELIWTMREEGNSSEKMLLDITNEDQPEKLLSLPGRIGRVGIADEVVAGFIELAFEVESDTPKQILFMQGQEWAVWQLRAKLEDIGMLKKSFTTDQPAR